MNPNSPLAPSPLSKDEPPSGLDCSGEFKAAPDIRLSGPAAGGGYLLPVEEKVKVQGVVPDVVQGVAPETPIAHAAKEINVLSAISSGDRGYPTKSIKGS